MIWPPWVLTYVGANAVAWGFIDPGEFPVVSSIAASGTFPLQGIVSGAACMVAVLLELSVL